jgi:hypothetical protein
MCRDRNPQQTSRFSGKDPNTTRNPLNKKIENRVIIVEVINVVIIIILFVIKDTS